MYRRFATTLLLFLPPFAHAQAPAEPIQIEHGVPQFFIDDWLVDNRFAIKYKNNAVVHVARPPKKHPANPVFSRYGGYVNVARNPEGKFQLWMQVHDWEEKLQGGKTNYAIAYLESENGIEWREPRLRLHSWMGRRENNIVLKGPRGARASGPQILLTLPEEDHRGYRYVMTYRTGGAGKENDGIRLTVSHDGIHWETEGEMRLKHIHSDTLNSIVYDPVRKRYLMTCRAKDRYRRFRGDMIDTGASRRISVLTNDSLWSDWEGSPRAILTPDEVDAEENNNFFYGMPVHYYAGIYWGFLWVFRMNDPIHTELVTSRDGFQWKRSPLRVPLVARGGEGGWDDGMVFAGPHWVEVGDEWRFYYAGHDGPHDSKERKAAIGLATCPRERLVALHGPGNGGGVVVTRRLIWPGGNLFLNLGPGEDGKATVRVSDSIRDPLEGFNHGDCLSLTGNSVRQKVTWKGGRSMEELEGKEIRLEFFLLNADLFSFVAK